MTNNINVSRAAEYPETFIQDKHCRPEKWFFAYQIATCTKVAKESDNLLFMLCKVV
jgi:hypothetical protein